VQGAYPRRVEGIGHYPPHRAHIDAAVGAAGPVPGGKPQPGRKAVVLGGVGVHNEHLRRGAVLFNGKGQGLRRLGGDVCRRLPGVILDAARTAWDVLFAAALPELLLCHRPCIGGAGFVRLQRHKIPLHSGLHRGGSFLLRRHGRGPRHAFRRCCRRPALHRLLPQMQQSLCGGHWCR